jgi:hypothetical protein
MSAVPHQPRFNMRLACDSTLHDTGTCDAAPPITIGAAAAAAAAAAADDDDSLSCELYVRACGQPQLCVWQVPHRSHAFFRGS